MDAATIINDFMGKGVHLARTDHGAISITSVARLTDADRDLLRKHKAAVLAELGVVNLVNLVNIDSVHYPPARIVHAPKTKFTDPHTAKPQPDLDREAFEERAAVMEFSGGMSRHQAELLARCDQCRHFTRFANCSMPREAGLSVRFELVPAPGQTCQIFEARPAPAAY